MDSLITAAARALAAGDPLGALNRVALRNDAAALALRGIAMAQLGEFVRARLLLRKAARAFGPKETLARARCVVAEAELALVSRDLGWPSKALDAARATLDAHGDRLNAAHARYLEVRRLLLLGAWMRPRPRSRASIPAPSRAHRGPRMSWWWRGLRCAGCRPARRAQPSHAPRAPRAKRASRR